jgi:hypothetical protein
VVTRKPKRGEVRHAEVRCADRRVRLVAVLTPDGWLAHAYDLDSQQTQDLGQWPKLQYALDQLESYAREGLKFTGGIEWSTDSP